MFYAQNCCKQQKIGNNIKFTGKCISSGREYSVTVPIEGLLRYDRGDLIQNAFPQLSADDREFLISGISPGCFEDFLNL